MKIIRFAALVVILLTALPVHAIENSREIDWDNFLPYMAPLDNPFTSLTTDQLIDLETFVGITKLQRHGSILEVNETLKVGVELRHKLESQELDVDELVDAYLHQEGELARRDQMTNAEVDGQTVRIPGYALPLEHKDTGVRITLHPK